MLSVRASRNIWAASAQSGLDKGEDDDPRRCALMRKWSYFGQVNNNAFHVGKMLTRILYYVMTVVFVFNIRNTIHFFLFFFLHVTSMN